MLRSGAASLKSIGDQVGQFFEEQLVLGLCHGAQVWGVRKPVDWTGLDS